MNPMQTSRYMSPDARRSSAFKMRWTYIPSMISFTLSIMWGLGLKIPVPRISEWSSFLTRIPLILTSFSIIAWSKCIMVFKIKLENYRLHSLTWINSNFSDVKYYEWYCCDRCSNPYRYGWHLLWFAVMSISPEIGV